MLGSDVLGVEVLDVEVLDVLLVDVEHLQGSWTAGCQTT